jgi:predicted SnoaL-like aldol condensation-catalyzing enzyme
MSRIMGKSMHEEAVTHARLAEQSAELAWGHLRAEYTQDIEKVLATLATNEPLTWTLPEMFGDDGSLTYLAGTDLEEIRGQYKALRSFVEIHGWDPVVEIRQGWYTMTHGVVTLKMLDTGEYTKSQTVTMFPIGRDGILGEVQIGGYGVRPDRPLGDLDAHGVPYPQDRLEALSFHNAYVDALRAEDVAAIVAANSHNGAAAIRNYLTDESTVLNATGSRELGEYFSAFFQRYGVRDIQLVNRVAESWYVFAELHWTVEERAGERRTLEFCTAETSPLASDGLYWARTGAGSDPVEA